MKRRITTQPAVVNLLKEKARHSSCTYKISAVAFDKKGNILGHTTNKHSTWNVLDKDDGVGRSGTAKHAEKILIERYSGLIKTIVICRIGRSGVIRKIDPCPTCQKIANKLGIKIISVSCGSSSCDD